MRRRSLWPRGGSRSAPRLPHIPSSLLSLLCASYRNACSLRILLEMRVLGASPPDASILRWLRRVSSSRNEREGEDRKWAGRAGRARSRVRLRRAFDGLGFQVDRSPPPGRVGGRWSFLDDVLLLRLLL